LVLQDKIGLGRDPIIEPYPHGVVRGNKLTGYTYHIPFARESSSYGEHMSGMNKGYVWVFEL
jgi:hypothetical protein